MDQVRAATGDIDGHPPPLPPANPPGAVVSFWLWHCRDSKQARREAAELGVGRRSTYKMDNNGKRIAKGARLSVPGSRFDGAQVSHLFPSPLLSQLLYRLCSVAAD